MELLVPAEAVVAVADSPATWNEGLLPEEEAYLGGRVAAGRRQEFTAGRNCARRALAQLGAPPGPLLAGDNREPRWPPGVVGSITHTGDYCAAAVAWSNDMGGLGIDAELHRPLPHGVAAMVCTQRERDWIASAPDGTHWDTVVFCAKESVFKAWFPSTGRWLGFDGAELAIEPREGRFDVRFLVPVPPGPEGRPPRLAGRFAVAGKYVLTAVAAAPRWSTPVVQVHHL